MPQSAVRLSPIKPGDRDLITRWLRQPAVQSWMGSASTAEAAITLALRSDAAICRMITLDGASIGYAQAMDAGQIGGHRAPEIPPGTWDCELFIGADAQRGKAYGRRALELLVDDVFGSTLAVACAIFVSVRNERAVRAYEAVGFRWLRIWDDAQSGPGWLMLRERSPR